MLPAREVVLQLARLKTLREREKWYNILLGKRVKKVKEWEKRADDEWVSCCIGAM